VRLRLAAASLAAAALAALGWIAAAPAENPVLLASVGPGFVISLHDASGADVKQLAPGAYTIRVNDQSELHNFHLSGPGVDVSTAVEFIGMVEWQVTLTDGTYRFQCDPHATLMRGSFTVGTTTPPPPPPPPPVHRLSARVGPGARIAFVKSAPAGKAAITVRDVSASDNFHLIGPGVNKKTSVKGKQTVTWNVTLRAGTYVFRSDAHAKLRGTTRVS
jgi:plastocyanin